MRVLLAIGLLLCLAACSGDPRAYGITGPGQRAFPSQPAGSAPDTTPVPGVSTSGSYYGPSTVPTSGDSGFWGYN